MFKLRYLPQYFLVILLLLLIFFEAWTYYLGTTSVTFERLIGHTPYSEIRDLSLRRYREGAISPHLFTIETDREEDLIQKLKKECGMQKVSPEQVPKVIAEVDPEMMEVVAKSPYIYLSERYDLNKPKEGRLCLLFRDREKLYLFVNGNL